jgi:ribosomal protein S27AE
VFSPEAQKTAYEVEEKFVDWLQAFCEACQAKRALLIGQHKAYQERWATGRAELLKDIRFLEDWRSVLRELRAYGKADESLEGMLSKLIRES